MGQERSNCQGQGRAGRSRVFRECPLEEATLVMARYGEQREDEEPDVRGFKEVEGVVLPGETVLLERDGEPGWVVSPEPG